MNKIDEYFNKGFIILGVKEEDKIFVEQDLNKMNFESIECEGTYRNIKGISSFMVLDDGKNRLKNKGIDIIRKYNQETFLFKPSLALDKGAYLINGLGKIKTSYSDYVINDGEQKFYTKLSSGVCFSFLK